MRWNCKQNPDGTWAAGVTARTKGAVLGGEGEITAKAEGPTAQEAVRRASLRLYRNGKDVLEPAEHERAGIVTAAADKKVQDLITAASNRDVPRAVQRQARDRAQDAAADTAKTVITATPTGAAAYWAGEQLAKNKAFRNVSRNLWGAISR